MFRSLFSSLGVATLLAFGSVVGPTYAASSIQTGDGLIVLSADMPEEVRVGESFTYDVDVTNSSDNVMLHDVKLMQQAVHGFTIESIEAPGGSEAEGQQNNSEESSDQGEAEGRQFAIPTLRPGESQTLKVTATADEEGELRSCLAIASYTPAICLTTQVVKPQLELSKVAPKNVNRCNVIDLEYTLKNGGTGDVGPIRITDSLGEGLITVEGASELSFEVDGLEAGERRRFIAQVYAKKPGEFSSRAVAKAVESDLKSRSKESKTVVTSADLAAKVTGPKRIYGEELVRFSAEITNTGNTAAEDVRVKVSWPESANLVDLGEPSIRSPKDSKDKESADTSENENQQSKPAPADSPSEGGEQTAANDQEGSGSSTPMQDETLVVDRLEPDQTASFEYALRPGQQDRLPTKISATYVCTVETAEDQSVAKARAESTATASAKVVRLPAIQLMVVDDEDPVTQGDEVVYTIRVWNEGDAPDNNVQVVAELPDGLEFVSADGPTSGNRNGSEVTFKPIETMEPGDRADFKVTAKSTGAENVRFAAKLTSKKLPSEVAAEEPTRLFER